MNRPLRVLIVEDQEDDALLTLRVLQEGGYEPASLRVDTAQALAVALETQPWDVVLCDYTLPQHDGEEALALVRSRKPDLPVIFVTGTIGEETAVRLIKAGAHDYILKDRPARLPVAVEQAQREAAERRVHAETQRALHDTAAQLGGILNAATDAIFEIDEAGTVMLANQAMHRLFGWPPGALLNQPLSVIMPPEQREPQAADLRRFLDTGESAVVGHVTEMTGLRRDGSRVCCELSLAALTHHSGERRFVGILRDITARKAAEEEVRRANERFSALIRSSPVAIGVLGVEGRVELWNPAAERLFGWTEAEVLGRPLPTVPPDKRDEHEALRREVLAGQPLVGQELRWQRKDGAAVLVSLSVAPLHDSHDAMTGLLVMMADITERKLLEIRAQRLDRLATLGQLLSGIAHELKNPLFVITGRLYLLKDKLRGRPAPEIEADVAPIAEAAERMTKIVERFLQLARPAPQTMAPVSVEQVVQQTVDFLAHELMKHQVTVVRDFAPNLPPILTDRHQIQGVLLNLTLNAMQAMAEAHGRGTLTVRVASVTDRGTRRQGDAGTRGRGEGETRRRGDAEEEGRGDAGTRRQGDAERGRRGDTEIAASPRLPVSASEEERREEGVTRRRGEGKKWIEIKIQDDGPGIPPEHRAKLFDPFFTTKEPGKGTGLGLWIARSTVMALGGTVDCESDVGRGATFTVRLPVADEPLTIAQN